MESVVTLDHAIIRDADFLAAGRSWRFIDTLLHDRAIERIAPGTYLRVGIIDADTATLASIALLKPQATQPLTSTLDRHDLTDEIPAHIDIVLPRGSRPVKTAFTTIRWHSFGDATFNIGRTTIELAEDIQIGLYKSERTIIDSFRIRHLGGPEAAIDALKRWLRQPGSQPSSLLTMAKYFPQAYPSSLTLCRSCCDR